MEECLFDKIQKCVESGIKTAEEKMYKRGMKSCDIMAFRESAKCHIMRELHMMVISESVADQSSVSR